MSTPTETSMLEEHKPSPIVAPVAAPAAPPTIIYVAIDIEATGSRMLSDPIVSIGVCVGTEGGCISERRRFNMEVAWPGPDTGWGDFEPRCWSEYWVKLPRHIRAVVRSEALPHADAMQQFRTFLDGLEDRYPEPAHEIRFITDNPSFDHAKVDAALERYQNRLPMRYSTVGKYRQVICIDSIRDAFVELFGRAMVDERIKGYIGPNVTHDHDPMHDAEVHYHTYLALRSTTR